MKTLKILGLISALLAATPALAIDTVLRTNKIKLGDGANTVDKVLEFNNGVANKPKIRYSFADGKFQFSEDGVAYENFAAATPTVAPYLLSQAGIAASVSANALTVALKQSDGGTDPTAGIPVKVSFRSSTATSGAYNVRTVSSALSVVVPSGTTLGTASGVTHQIYVYALDNSGTVELALSLSLFSSESVQSTSAISGGSSKTTLYSATARSNVPIRYLGRITIAEATAGTWATSPTEITPLSHVVPPPTKTDSEIRYRAGNGFGSTATNNRRFSALEVSTGNGITYSDSATDGAAFTINEDGEYAMEYHDSFGAGGVEVAIGVNSDGTSSPGNQADPQVLVCFSSVANAGNTASCSGVRRLNRGDVVRALSNGSGSTPSTSATKVKFQIIQLSRTRG